MNQFKAIESVRMGAKRAKRRKEMGEKIDPGRARLGKKMNQLVVYTSLPHRHLTQLGIYKFPKLFWYHKDNIMIPVLLWKRYLLDTKLGLERY